MINKYDIKYILKKVIIFFIIFAIFSLLHATKTKALSYYDFNLSLNPSQYHEVLYYTDTCDSTYASCYNNSGQSSGNLVFLKYNTQIAGAGYSAQNFAGSQIYATGGVYAHRFYGGGISGSNLKGKRFFTYTIGGQYNGFNNARYLIRDTTNNSTAIGTWFPCEPMTLPTESGSLTFTQFSCELWYDEFEEDHTYEIITQSIGKTKGDYDTTVKGFVTYYGIHIFFYSDYSQETIQKIEETNQAINEVNDSINNDDIDYNSASSSASQWNSKNASDTAISDFLLMPIHLIQAYLSGMNSSCTPFNLGTLFEHELILPCINIGGLLGDAIWVIIDILFSGFMILALGKRFVKIFNDFTNLRDNQVDEIYGGGNK